MEFKGIAEILDKFTFAQRILALLMLLMTLVTITLGPKIIDATTTSNAECMTESKRQGVRITYLEKVVDTLDTKIVTNQRKYTNDSAKREAEFVAMLDELKRDISSARERKMPIRASIKRYPANDTIMVEMDQIQTVHVESVSIPDTKILRKIEMMKKKIKNDTP